MDGLEYEDDYCGDNNDNNNNKVTETGLWSYTKQAAEWVSLSNNV